MNDILSKASNLSSETQQIAPPIDSSNYKQSTLPPLNTSDFPTGKYLWKDGRVTEPVKVVDVSPSIDGTYYNATLNKGGVVPLKQFSSYLELANLESVDNHTEYTNHLAKSFYDDAGDNFKEWARTQVGGQQQVKQQVKQPQEQDILEYNKHVNVTPNSPDAILLDLLKTNEDIESAQITIHVECSLPSADLVRVLKKSYKNSDKIIRDYILEENMDELVESLKEGVLQVLKEKFKIEIEEPKPVEEDDVEMIEIGEVEPITK